MPLELWERVNGRVKVCGLSRSGYFRRCLEQDLSVVGKREHYGKTPGSVARDVGGQEVDAGLQEKVKKALTDALSGKPEVFAALGDKDLANAVLSLVPKLKSVDADLEVGVLSLSRSLERLPKMEDVTAENARLVERMKGMETELRMMRERDKGVKAVFRDREAERAGV